MVWSQCLSSRLSEQVCREENSQKLIPEEKYSFTSFLALLGKMSEKEINI